jgi:hypothetical protein
MANEALQRVTETAQELGSQAKQAAANVSTQATGTVKDVLNNQVRAGADLVGKVAQSVNLAADNLSQSAPQIAELSRAAAQKIEFFSTELRTKSADELFEDASDFARRQPAVVFGAAAVLGFALFRMFKAGSAHQSSPSRGGVAPSHERWPGSPPRDIGQNPQFAGHSQAGVPEPKPSSPYGS